MKIDRSLIAGMPLFKGFAADDLDDVLGEAKAARCAKGATIFEQGAPAHSFYLLLHGRVRAYKLTPEGQQVVIRFVGPGELFGIAMAIGAATYPATAAAVVDCVALSWPTTVWQGLVARHPALAVATLQTVGGRLQEAQTRVLEMSTEEVERRVAHALLRLAEQAGKKSAAGILIEFPISRQDIAEMTGTTLHTVSRLLSAWQERGIVEGGRQKVLIRDVARLRALAEKAEEA